MSEENWNKDKKKGAPPCGLLWRIEQSAFGQGDETAALDMIRNMRQAISAINASPYEKNAHILLFAPEGAATESLKILEGLKQIAAHNGLVLLVEDSLALAAEAKLDGIVFKDIDKAIKARDVIGAEPIIALEINPEDDVSRAANFIDLSVLSSKYSAPEIAKFKAENPNLAVMSAVELNNDNAGPFINAGCDFLNASHYMNTHSEGAAKAAVNMLYAIELALSSAQSH